MATSFAAQRSLK